MKKILFLVSFMGLFLFSCSDDENDNSQSSSLTPVKFQPYVEQLSGTRAVKLDWSENDQIAIFSDIAVKKDGNTSTASITYTRGGTEGEWASPGDDERWYFADAIRQHNFYVYYPVGSAASYTAVEVPDISGQDGTQTVAQLKEHNNFLRGDGVATREGMIANIQMFRVFAIINLNINLSQDAFVNNEAQLSAVKFTSMGNYPLVNLDSSSKGTVDLSSGNITCANGPTTVTLAPSGGITLTPTAQSVPILIFGNHGSIQVQFIVNGKTSTAVTLGGNSSFVGGRVYNYNVTLHADIQPTGLGDPFIFDWLPFAGNDIAPIVPN